MLQIKVPPLGESIVQATISRWLKREGDAVQAGDTLVELETDKVTVEVPALKAGVLVKQEKREGDVVAVDEVLGELDETAAPAAAVEKKSAAPSQSATAADAPAQTQTRAAPSAKREASEQGVDLATVSGTGRGGVVSKTDVLDAVSARATPEPAPAT